MPDTLYTLLIEDMLDQVGDIKFLSKIDLSKGFYKVPIRDEDKDKTVLCTLGKFSLQQNGIWINECTWYISKDNAIF